MVAGSDNKFPKVILEEVLSDGSATTTPAADHRSLFLGEDGSLHLKDSAAAVTDIGGGGTPDAHAASHEDGGSDEIDVTGLVGAGGGGVDLAPNVEKVYLQSLTNSTSHAITITAVSAGKRIIVFVSSYNRDVNTPTCTNVTFTEVLAATFGAGAFLSVYVGVVAGGSSGTTITVTATGSDWIITDTYVIGDALTPAAGVNATLTNTDAAATAIQPIGPLAVTQGDLFVVGVAQNNGTTAFASLDCSAPIVVAPRGANAALISGVGRAQSGSLMAWYTGGTSGGDLAAAIGVVS